MYSFAKNVDLVLSELDIRTPEVLLMHPLTPAYHLPLAMVQRRDSAESIPISIRRSSALFRI